MSKFYLKDWHGKEKEFTDEKIFVRGEDGELIQFTQGEGDKPAVVQPLEVTENGTYTAPDGVDGFNEVKVLVEALAESAKKFVGGEFTTGSANGYSYEITHNLGFVPDAILIYPKGSVTVNTTRKVFCSYGFKQDFARKLGLTKFGVLCGNTMGSTKLYASSSETHDIETTTSDSYYPWGATATLFKTPIGLQINTTYIWMAFGQFTSNLQDKTVNVNGTYTADSGYDGLGSVTVNVASSSVSLLETPITKQGTFKATDSTSGITINHDLGVLPDCVVVFGTTTGENKLCYLCGFRNGIPTAPYTQEYIRNTADGLLRGGLGNYIEGESQWGAINGCNESSFKVGGNLCQLDTSIEYTWQAVRYTTYEVTE